MLPARQQTHNNQQRQLDGCLLCYLPFGLSYYIKNAYSLGMIKRPLSYK